MKKTPKILLLIIASLLLFFFLGLVPNTIFHVLIGRGIQQKFIHNCTILIVSFVGIIASLLIFQKQLESNSLRKMLSHNMMITISILIMIWVINIKPDDSKLAGIFYFVFFLGIPSILQLGLNYIDKKYGLVNFSNFILLILSINLITWFIIGKPNTLLLGSTNLYNFGLYQYDNIYIDYSIYDLPFYKKSSRDYRELVFEEYFQRLQKRLKSKDIKIIDLDKNTCFSDTIDIEKTPIYSVLVIDAVPFICYVQKNLIAGTSSLGFHSIQIWFFKWVNIYEEMDWMS